MRTLCKHCGVSVRVIKNESYDSLAGTFYAETYHHFNPMEKTYVYIKHECLPENVETFDYVLNAIREQLSPLAQGHDSADLSVAYDDYESQRVTFNRVQHELSNKRECPKCKAEIGQPCLNLTVLKHGIQQPVKQPHAERLPPFQHPDFKEVVQNEYDVQRMYDIVIKIRQSMTAQELLDYIDREVRTWN